jgi:hypothetical protein
MALESRVTQANATALFTTTESRVTQANATALFTFSPSIPNSHVTQLSISPLFHEIDTRLTQLSISPLFHEIDTRLTQLSVTALTQAAAVLKRHFTRIPRIRI